MASVILLTLESSSRLPQDQNQVPLVEFRRAECAFVALAVLQTSSIKREALALAFNRLVLLLKLVVAATKAPQHLSRLTVHGNREAPKAAGPSRLHKIHMKDDNAKRKRSGITHAKKKEIEMAKKKEQLRQHMKNREWSFVFVGNV